MATKRLRSGKWEYTIRNRALLKRPVYLRFADQGEGDAYVRRAEALLAQGIVPAELAERADDMETCQHLLEAWQRTRSLSPADESVLPALAARVGTVRIAALTLTWCEAWIDRLKGEGLAPSTIRHYVGTFARCIDWCVRRESALLPVNPLRLLPKRYATGGGRPDVERDRRVSAAEEKSIREILAGAKPAQRQRALELHHADALVLLFDLAIESGMRLREMFTLQVPQVDINNRTIFLEKTKNGKRRQVPLSSVAVALLSAHLQTHSAGRVFPWWSGDPKDLKRTTSKLSAQFGRIFAAAGCADVHFHDLRHEATCRFYERTQLTDLQIALILGHSDMRSLRRYANLRGSYLATLLW